jgi:hypothetical protein
MNKCFEATSDFLTRCDEIEMEFAYSISDSLYGGEIHHDINYSNAHTEALLQFIDLFTKFKGLVPEPLFSKRIDDLNETINTNCGWE